MPFARNLECPICNKTYGINNWLEDKCGYRLRINYDLDARNEGLDLEKLKSKGISHWKYFDFFPLEKRSNIISIGEGGTNMIKSDRLAQNMGLKNLYFKLELTNPSASFKDRPISIGVSMAIEANAETVSAASSGNAAASLSSLGSRAGLEVIVFVPERASKSKISQLLTLGAKVIRVKGDESSKGDPSVKLFRSAIEKWGWIPSPSFGPFNPHQFEGTKSLGYEIVEQLNWNVPDFVLCNTGSGGLLAGTARGFKDWYELDWISNLPKMVAVQPQACNPVVKAIENRVNPYEFKDQIGFPNTVAGGLADPHPWDGDSAIEMIYDTNGTAITVTDSEILEAQQDLASKEGIFGSPSGVASVAALEKLVNDGTVDPSDLVVLPITGHGLKDPDVLKDQSTEAILCNVSIKELAKKLGME